jgi:hypothetical protein
MLFSMPSMHQFLVLQHIERPAPQRYNVPRIWTAVVVSTAMPRMPVGE